MEVTLLYVEGCPHWELADDRLRAALARVGHGDVTVTRQVVGSATQAEALGFPGSPTILVDGRDPFAGDDASPGLSCRLYATPDGLAGAPAVEQLVEALEGRSARSDGG